MKNLETVLIFLFFFFYNIYFNVFTQKVYLCKKISKLNNLDAISGYLKAKLYNLEGKNPSKIIINL